ncbi:MAG TPA: acyl carrier protein [Rhodocyclaceae bacterium]|nr:acyl carrier protein [Rhodocyclaceae bacterium]
MASDLSSSDTQFAATPADGTISSSVSETLAKIWQELLHVSYIKPSDDFFDLGGDSLGAIRMLERIGNEFGEELLEPDIIYTASCFNDLTIAVTQALAQRDLHRAEG